MDRIIIKIGNIATAKGGDALVTFALGSCVGLCLYDRELRLGGMAHIFLPDSKAIRNGAEPPDEGARYADTAVKNLIDAMTKQGASKRRLTARLYGGARMFTMGPPSLINSMEDIGGRNSAAALEALAQHGIQITETDLGGSTARTLTFYTDDGSVHVNERRKPIS